MVRETKKATIKELRTAFPVHLGKEGAVRHRAYQERQQAEVNRSFSTDPISGCLTHSPGNSPPTSIHLLQQQSILNPSFVRRQAFPQQQLPYADTIYFILEV